MSHQMLTEHSAGLVAAQAVGSGQSDPALLGRIGTLDVRLAESDREVAAAQALRARVFCETMGWKNAGRERCDADRFDPVCDHLLVIDRAAGDAIVGTYRLLRQDMASAAGGFYSQDEFEIGALSARHPTLRFLELGRSCVLEPYRTKRTIELLWQGIWAYVRRHDIGAMTGCASFTGTIPAAHAAALSFLHHNCRATGDWLVPAVAHRRVEMDLMPVEAVDVRTALASMPPLIKGYLRLGAKVGDGCVIDDEFGTTDVFIVLPVSAISERYVNYYGADATRFAA